MMDASLAGKMVSKIDRPCKENLWKNIKKREVQNVDPCGQEEIMDL